MSSAVLRQIFDSPRATCPAVIAPKANLPKIMCFSFIPPQHESTCMHASCTSCTNQRTKRFMHRSCLRSISSHSGNICAVKIRIKLLHAHVCRTEAGRRLNLTAGGWFQLPTRHSLKIIDCTGPRLVVVFPVESIFWVLFENQKRRFAEILSHFTPNFG